MVDGRPCTRSQRTRQENGEGVVTREWWYENGWLLALSILLAAATAFLLYLIGFGIVMLWDFAWLWNWLHPLHHGFDGAPI
jgi:hypothetical protein